MHAFDVFENANPKRWHSDTSARLLKQIFAVNGNFTGRNEVVTY